MLFQDDRTTATVLTLLRETMVGGGINLVPPVDGEEDREEERRAGLPCPVNVLFLLRFFCLVHVFLFLSFFHLSYLFAAAWDGGKRESSLRNLCVDLACRWSRGALAYVSLLSAATIPSGVYVISFIYPAT